MTIAIVDDIKEERVLLRTRLEKIFHQKDMGFHCCEYENGEAFLEASKDQDITVLFLDIYMDGLSSVTNSILHGLNYMTSPAKNAGVALVIHLAAFVLMMTVFKMNVYALVGGNIVFALAMSILNLIKIRKVSGFRMDLLSTFGKPFTAAAIMGVITYGVFRLFDLLVGGRVIPVLVSLIVAVLVYAVVLLKIGTLSEDDILDLPMGGKILRAAKKFHLMPS